MKTVTFVPTICRGEGAKYSGGITLRLPTFDEKFQYLEDTGIELNKDGEVEMGTTSDRMRMIRKMVKLSEKHYIVVELKNNATGEELKSFEDLQYDTDAHAILVEVATQLVSGFKLGNA